MGADIIEDITEASVKRVLTRYSKYKKKDIIETKVKEIMKYLKNNKKKVNEFVKEYRNKQGGGKKKKTRKKKSLRKKRKKRRGIKTRSRKGGNPEILVLFVICSFAFYWIDLVPGNSEDQHMIGAYESDTDESDADESDGNEEERNPPMPQQSIEELASLYNRTPPGGEEKQRVGDEAAGPLIFVPN